MKLFFKEQRMLIVLQLLQLTMIGGVIWLSGFHDLPLILYALFLAFFLFFTYFLYKFIVQRKLYKRLSSEIKQLDEVQQDLGDDSLSVSVSQLLKKQYELYEQQIMELQDKQEEHLIFINRWIHQMKTPVAVLELMAEEIDEPQASDMREEVERLKTGLQTVLHMARLRTIERDFHVKKVDLKALLKEVNQENKRYFIRNNVYPRLEVEIEDTIVESDEKWLHFIITQLVHNAVKYSAGKSEQIIQRIYLREERLVLEIKDFGIGIQVSDMKRIFDPFYTGESGRKYRESTGVGLYLVKEVSDYLGHEIKVYSEVNDGTSFQIVFYP